MLSTINSPERCVSHPRFISLYGLLFFLTVTLTACSSHNTANIVTHNQDALSPDLEEQQVTLVESDQELKEELAALEKLDWKGTSSNQTAPAETTVYDFPITKNKQVEFYLDLFQNRQKKYFKKWLARSTKYLPVIKQELKAAGLPQDLAYLAMIESGYNPSAYSHAHAAGLWQFIRGTGRNYGLRIDSWVDERRDPQKATKAAVAYLANLYERFGDWQFAVAGYNAGEGKIERGIAKYNAVDFWDLAQHKYLRLETQRYVPKLIAAILIARNPAHYGFTNIPYQQPDQYDLISVPAGTDLQAIAVSGSTSVKKLKGLNNELRKNMTPPSTHPYQLKIPAGTHDLIAANLTRLHPVVTTGYKIHRVARGDTVARISRRYRISRTTLLKANRLRSARLKRGQRLRIPYRTTKYVLLKKGQSVKEYYATHHKNGRMILHELRKGETLSQVSKRYHVPVDLLIQWNDISNVRRLRPGQQLALYLDKPRKSPAVMSSLHSATGAVISLSDIKKRPPAGQHSNHHRVAVSKYYKVRNGDSLWSIARKFRVSARDLRRWNALANNMIHPGKKLVIKKS